MMIKEKWLKVAVIVLFVLCVVLAGYFDGCVALGI